MFNPGTMSTQTVVSKHCSQPGETRNQWRNGWSTSGWGRRLQRIRGGKERKGNYKIAADE